MHFLSSAHSDLTASGAADDFVAPGSIVREIWGDSDTILFIFAGAAAEFALNKAVDWLYFTGKLPSDPIGRLFSTVGYARQIVFATRGHAHRAIDTVRMIHGAVESSRGAQIPDWAYRDVLYLLVHYSIAAFELLHRPLDAVERAEVYDVFRRVGARMGIPGLPPSYAAWLPERDAQLQADLVRSACTTDLFLQYRKHLGGFRFKLLKGVQKEIVPPLVCRLLGYRPCPWMRMLLPVYRLMKRMHLDAAVKHFLLPAEYKAQIRALDRKPGL